ncbi:MAG: type ISP restriction/modification enzyme, partial [Brevinema sp.]
SIIETINLYDESMFYKGKNYKDSHDTEDPFIYMYENFLKEFDADTRNARGVFYTPIEVVNYIIRSIDELLKLKLGLGQGLRHKDVHILDFATGTGTFLLGGIEHIYRDLENSGSSGLWKSQVKDFILQNLYGFEYLVVPYILAHFRIHQYLEDCGYHYDRQDRLKLYLTNTLDNSSSASIPMFPELNRESADAFRIKNEEPILVIMGNPPYNSSSDPMNSRKWIMDMTDTYKEGLNEKKLNLNDDYIKFMRFAHWKMQQAEKGIVGVIVNNSFINGLVHREMRNKLMQTFDEIYIYDLHGNINKAEKCPDGSTDFNIFNIASAGVCIAFFVKTGLKNNPDKGVYHQEIFGTQAEKKRALIPCSWQGDHLDKKWHKLQDEPKWHWFVPRNANARYWDEFKGVHEIFNKFGSGVQTERDNITIHFEKKSLLDTLQNFITCPEAELTKLYATKDSRDWTVTKAKKDITKFYPTKKESLIQQVHYRPFDFRYTYYTGTSRGFVGTPGKNITQHFIGHNNVGLVFVRQQAEDKEYDQVFITNQIVDRRITLSNRGAGSLAPLYIYGNKQEGTLGLEEACKPNWTPAFSTFLSQYHSTQPETVLAYIYAVLFAPSYRATYAEDLSYDYPRVPFTTDKAKFDVLAGLGQQLIDLHLLKTISSPSVSDRMSEVPSVHGRTGEAFLRVGYPTDGDHRVDEIRRSEDKIFINSTQAFTNVPAEVWSYQIGGYQVLDKWLKSRKDRILTLDEITHFQQMCGIIAETIRLQQQIDNISGVW